MSKSKGETLDLLRTAYDALTKAGRDSLSKAYAFGNVVHALHGIFTYGQLAEELGVTSTTVSKYAKLYRKYPTEQLLMHTAAEMSTYDVGVLSSDADTARYVYAWHCLNCGSFDVKKERETDSVRAAKEAQAVASLGNPGAHPGAQALRNAPAEALDAGYTRR